jgi:hypothetical protein
MGCLGGGCAGFVLSFTAFIVTFSAALAGSRHEYLLRILGVLLLDVAIVFGAYAAIKYWAPRAGNPNLVRTFAITAGIIGLGGLTLCSGMWVRQ